MNVGLSDNICGDLSSHEAQENSVQDVVSSLLMYRSILEASVKVSCFDIGITSQVDVEFVIFLLFVIMWLSKCDEKHHGDKVGRNSDPEAVFMQG